MIYELWKRQLFYIIGFKWQKPNKRFCLQKKRFSLMTHTNGTIRELNEWQKTF
jgi:hypothetical protein